MKYFAVIGALLWPHVGFAFEPQLPDAASLLANEATPDIRYMLPLDVFTGDQVPSETLRGLVETKSWRIEEGQVSPRVLMDTLRDQVIQQGYDIILDCHAQVCGGFGFRYEIDVLTPPDMFVDLAHFHFLSAAKGRGENRIGLTILTSQTALAGMVQITKVTAGTDKTTAVERPKSEVVRPVERPNASTETSTDLISVLETTGHAVLLDLVFETGEAALGEAESLSNLADWLIENPTVKVALVGHTDNTGNATANLALSQGRADAVMARLIDVLDVPSAQLEARGLGYFAPITTNDTPEGRDLNRRVEVVVVSAP